MILLNYICKQYCGFVVMNLPLLRPVRWQPTPVLLPGESQGRRSLVGAVYGVAQSQTRLSDFTFPLHFHALEKAMATHSSVLAGESQGPGSLVGAVYGVAQSQTRLKRLSSSSRASLGSETFYLILGVRVIVYLVSLENVFIDSIISVTNTRNLMHRSNKRIYSKLKKMCF